MIHEYNHIQVMERKWEIHEMEKRKMCSFYLFLYIHIYIYIYIYIVLGPSSLLEERSEIPIVFVVSFVLSATPQTGGNGQGI